MRKGERKREGIKGKRERKKKETKAVHEKMERRRKGIKGKREIEKNNN